jgi:hypothetical protein
MVKLRRHCDVAFYGNIAIRVQARDHTVLQPRGPQSEHRENLFVHVYSISSADYHCQQQNVFLTLCNIFTAKCFSL